MELSRVGVKTDIVYHGDLKNGNIYFNTHKYGINHSCVVYQGNYELVLEKIEIQHQETKAFHQFNVVNPDALTTKEVKTICHEMGGLKALLINGKYYDKNK
jgi:hypothetical protein